MLENSVMKKFLFTLLSFSTLTLFAKPVFRAGIMSDTHVTSDPGSCSILKDSLELFKAHKVDLVINAGDIADIYDQQAYVNYRKTFNSVFPDAKTRPQEIFAYAYHDIIKHPANDPWSAFKDVKKYLEISHDPYDIINFKGYTFVIYPQYHEPQKYRELLDKAEKARGNKPFFIIDHVPLHDTVVNSMNGNKAAKALVERHPDAIHISGHIHSLLTNELNIWQGKFTAVNAGFLHGSMRVKKSCDVAAIMEVYSNKIVFRRFFTDSKKEYKADSPWSIPLPFDGNNAPYNAENRLKNSVAPEFSANAKASAASTENGVVITFPQASPAESVHQYDIEFQIEENGKWRMFSHHNQPGHFFTANKEIAPSYSCTFSHGYFDAGKSYRTKITPVHFSGKTGAPLYIPVQTSSKPAAKVIFESKDPMKECICRYGYIGKDADKVHKAAEDGFYHVKEDNIGTRLYFPDYPWSGKENARFIFELDICHDAADRSSLLIVRDDNPANPIYIPVRCHTSLGCSGGIRYVVDYSLKRNPGGKLNLYIKNGGKLKVKFNYVRIELY